MTRPNKLECLYLAITYQSCLPFAGSTRSLPKKEASERSSEDLTGKGFQMANPLTYWASVTKEKSFIILTNWSTDNSSDRRLTLKPPPELVKSKLLLKQNLRSLLTSVAKM